MRFSSAGPPSGFSGGSAEDQEPLGVSGVDRSLERQVSVV